MAQFPSADILKPAGNLSKLNPPRLKTCRGQILPQVHDILRLEGHFAFPRPEAIHRLFDSDFREDCSSFENMSKSGSMAGSTIGG